MAIFIHCPLCNQQLDKMASECPHCGAELPPGVLYSLSIALGKTSSSVLMTTPEPLSLLCGLGQLYNGQTVKGLVLIVLGTVALTTIHLPIVQLLMPAVWLYAIIDAYLVARRKISPLTSPNKQTANRH
jgi:TM2 domain-containing membrane protein YozV